jgi:hypothetical protein
MSEESPALARAFFRPARRLINARAPSDANLEGNERIG